MVAQHAITKEDEGDVGGGEKEMDEAGEKREGNGYGHWTGICYFEQCLLCILFICNQQES